MKTRFKSWSKPYAPRRILAIRYQALGDVVITLPFLQDLKSKFPHTTLHFLTRREDAAIPENLLLFEKVIRVRGRRNAKIQFFFSMLLLPYLWWQRYDVVLDLQNSRITRILRPLLGAPAWCEFDRESPVLAAERTRHAINSVRLMAVDPETKFRFKIPDQTIFQKLRSAGWDGHSGLVVLNPAGSFTSRNWPIDRYVSFAKLWQGTEPIQFLVVGLASLQSKAEFLKKHLGRSLVDLTGKTTPAEVFQIIGKARFTLTEDSGLMHMSWVQGVPTLALFGSTRSDWSSPAGPWSRCLHSADLPCGGCMKAECRFGDVHCLTRYSPEHVFQQARLLLQQTNRS